ncbi:MAG TPA: hypothetical protein ENI05_14315 [Porticoccus sp.]|nr:hypothetical protein [Porticoccus sp.]
MTFYIVASGAYCENITDELPSLKKRVKESIGISVRRVGRFIQLALIGAGRASLGLPQHTGVYLTSGPGDMAATVEALKTIYRQEQAPGPISFINTVSNAACFYVAQCLSLQGPSSFVSSRYFSMEAGLKVAQLELEAQRVDAALVGVVDVVVAPLDEHRQRLGLNASSVLTEASHWLQLVMAPGERPVLATLQLVRQFPDRQALSLWLDGQSFSVDNFFAAGQSLDEQESDEWLSELGLQRFECCEDIGYFDGKVGRVLCEFIARGENSLLYLNADPHGRYMAIVLSKN